VTKIIKHGAKMTLTTTDKDTKTLKVTLVIPTYNEEGNLFHVLPKIPQLVDEVIIVDGHSSDNTVQEAVKLCPGAQIIYQEGKGKGNALRTGFDRASGDIVVTMDADGSMNPDEIVRFVDALKSGYDFAKGSRFIHSGGTDDAPRHRLFGNWALAAITNLLYRTHFTDVTYGYNAFSRRCLEKIKLRSWGFSIETEMAIKAKKAGMKITEVPSFESPRISGQAKLNSYRDGWLILKIIVAERFRE
jgi:glycosyltransferase involved in cell wall biosynthesis